jgi:hypothetical protein
MMLEAIEVTFPYASEPVFKTLEEAMASSVSIDRQCSTSDIASYEGQTIRFAGWCDEAIFLRLENAKVLHFQYTELAVELTIEADVPNDLMNEVRAQEVVLIFPSGHRMIWEKDRLIKSLQGKLVRRISAAQAGYFLYVTGADKNTEILWIDFVTDRITKRPLLYWGLTD